MLVDHRGRHAVGLGKRLQGRIAVARRVLRLGQTDQGEGHHIRVGRFSRGGERLLERRRTVSYWGGRLATTRGLLGRGLIASGASRFVARRPCPADGNHGPHSQGNQQAARSDELDRLKLHRADHSLCEHVDPCRDPRSWQWIVSSRSRAPVGPGALRLPPRPRRSGRPAG